jgi:hypothetical protein
MDSRIDSPIGRRQAGRLFRADATHVVKGTDWDGGRKGSRTWRRADTPARRTATTHKPHGDVKVTELSQDSCKMVLHYRSDQVGTVTQTGGASSERGMDRCLTKR